MSDTGKAAEPAYVRRRVTWSRITGINEPVSTRLSQVTGCACDAFGPIFDLQFRDRIYE